MCSRRRSKRKIILTDNEIEQFLQQSDVITAMSAVIAEVKEEGKKSIYEGQTLEEDKELFRNLMFESPLIILMGNYDTGCQNQGRKRPIYRMVSKLLLYV